MEWTVSKAEFARLAGVSKPRVSQWVRAGQIDADALVGEGRFARIRVDVACRQLAARLDVGQRFGNGIDTRLDVAASAGDRIAAPALAPGTQQAWSDPIADQIKAERLRALRLGNERAAEMRLAERGRYVLAASVEGALTDLGRQMLDIFEGGLVDMATGLSARLGVSQRDVLHELRAQFLRVRARGSAALHRKAAGLPALVEDVDAETGGGPGAGGRGDRR